MSSNRLHRAKAIPLAALLLGIVLITISIGAAMVDHDRKERDMNRALANEASQQTETLRDYFARSRSLTQVTASNPAFEHFYQQPGSRREKVRARGPVVRQSEDALAYLEELFPDSIGEACFIDRTGPENARAVKGRIAPLSDLSPDETAAPFFAPSFSLRPGQVYQARPYVSPDTQEWVVANATPIRTPGARANQAIVHFEISIESFRRNAAASAERFDVAIIDSRSGRVLVDSRYRQAAGESSALGRPRDERFTDLRAHAGQAGFLEVGKRMGAFEQVGVTRHNANDWTAVVMARSDMSSWLSSMGIAQLAVLAGALLMLAFGATSLRTSQRPARGRAARPAHRASQPPQPHRGPRLAAREPHERRHAVAGDLRPRRLQGVQRHLRPPGGRRVADQAGPEAERGRQGHRVCLPDGRRRVLRARSSGRRGRSAGRGPRRGCAVGVRRRFHDHGLRRLGAAPDRDRGSGRGFAEGRPAHVCEQGRRARLGRPSEHRRAAESSLRAEPGPRRPPRPGDRALRGRREEAAPERGGDGTPAPGRLPARRRQGRHPRFDPR